MDTKPKNTLKNVTLDSRCPMVDFVTIVSGKWAIPTLYRLMMTEGVMRFGELQRAIGEVTQKELTKQLRTFEALGIVTRAVFDERPPRVEYQITDLGKTLKPTFDSLGLWMEEHREELLDNERHFSPTQRMKFEAL
ncbi:winged helix-turn-helix transcriptional regulator [Vibrio ostreicida]|uniref:Helix-turn-helix domain-containing protein n=1 Tax=Vibrio ostreicida TaxID=526588 RepID=A0ABT8BSJ8_9VIBR|nr:helix-turn-helix domain-containing protein [Vibrio ostreicida]MDN3609639.1 helix-turn-helix domain-containing protein [Vibrio ostreicida]NPD09530.1 helix-turn-helix transcriptional regulator [Vibrio ostreicida]